MRFFAIIIFTALISVTAKSDELPAYDSKNLWIGPTLSLFVGFGVGVGFQGNYEQRGWIYTAADFYGVFLVWKSITDCHSPNDAPEGCPEDNSRKLSRTIFLTSRILQLVDSTIWSYQYYNKYKSTAFILPKDDGLSLNYAIEF